MSPIALGTVLKPMPARFWDKVDMRGPDDCWEWTAAREGPNKARHCHLAYGIFGLKEGGRHRTWAAHRMAYTLALGPIPKGMLVLHSCDNPPCCNPRHLRLGTHAENMADRDERGRLGRRDGAHNGRAKLTPDATVEIRSLREQGLTQQAIADRFDVHQSTISAVLRGAPWTA